MPSSHWRSFALAINFWLTCWPVVSYGC